MPKILQRPPYLVVPIKFGKGAQDPIPEDTPREASKCEILKVNEVVRIIQYYATTVDMTALMALSTIASEQAKATGHNIETIEQLLDYMASHPDATMRFRASDMILNIHLDASCLSVSNGRSRACGPFFLGLMPKN